MTVAQFASWNEALVTVLDELAERIEKIEARQLRLLQALKRGISAD